jgi:nucleotide sugar dehydrogenase
MSRSEIRLSTQESLLNLSSMIASKKAVIGIFGTGYVGLPLACVFAEAGFRTIAGDSDQHKILAIRQGCCYVEDAYASRVLPGLVSSGILSAEDDISHLASLADFSIITVPTPLTEKREPDLSYVIGVAEAIAEKLRPGMFVILESSVYPGTTDEILKPILERSGLKGGEDFGLAHSPERIVYGSTRYYANEIPKVVGGITPLCTQIAAELYQEVLQSRVVQVSDARTAEATKMLENTYRYVNIALANELAILHEKLGIDFFEVVKAASTKPFGFQAFYPGPGVGGHCIPKDPHYLSYKARQLGQDLKLIDTSREINETMIDHILKRLESRFRVQGRALQGLKAAILGLAFKEDVSDTRNSPSIQMVEHLEELGVELSAYDPLVHEIQTRRGLLVSSQNLEEAVQNADILVLVTPHTIFKEISLEELNVRTHPRATILDTRGFWSPTDCRLAGFDYIGLGRPDQD